MIEYAWEYWPNSLAGQPGTAAPWIILPLLPILLRHKGWHWSRIIMLELALCSSLLLFEHHLIAQRWHSWNPQSGELRYLDHSSRLDAGQVLRVWSIRYGRGGLGDCHLDLELTDGSHLRSITVDRQHHDCGADARRLNQQLNTQ